MRQVNQDDSLLFPNDRNNVLNSVYASALAFPQQVELVQPEMVQPEGVSQPLPKTVNVNMQPTVDLRLPHDGNPLVGQNGPLHDMRDDVLTVIDRDQFGHVLLIGSSGCGKTTTSFMVAKERFCVYVECRANGTAAHPFHIDSTKLKHPRGAPQYDAIKRRLTRELLARCSLLGILHKLTDGGLTPFQWHLLSISDNRRYAEALASLRSVFDGRVDSDLVGRILRAVADQVGQKPTLIVDEVHLLVETQRTVVVNLAKPEDKVDTFGASVCAITTEFGAALASCVWIGTQVSLEQSARLASAVFKSDGQTPVYAFCSFPYVEQGRFAELAEQILGEEYVPASWLMYGRPRGLAELINTRLRSSISPGQIIANVCRRSRIGAEIRRVLAGDFGLTDLLDLWLASIQWDVNHDVDRDGERFVPQRWGGTLAFTSQFARTQSWEQPMRTGGSLVQIEQRSQLAFEHILDEPVLVDAIMSYLGSLGGETPHQQLFRHAATKCCNFQGEPSIRGQLLDVAVLCKVVSLSADTTLSTWLPLSNAAFADVRDATFSVQRIVSGKGVLNRWVRAVLEAPNDDFIPGVVARNVCVRPETAAGADGAFVAFVQGRPVFVTVACAWYSDGVKSEKWKDQVQRSSVLFNQFTKKDGSGEAAQHFERNRTELRGALDAHEHRTLRVLFELPSRKGQQPANNVEGDALVVDNRNVSKVLGEQF